MDINDIEGERADPAERADDRGASLVEYALLIALIALVCVVAIAFLGQETSDSFGSNGSSLFQS